MWLTPYFSSPVWEDTAAGIITLTLCLLWIESVNLLVRIHILDKRFSRKVVHIFTGSIFLLCWNLFSSQPYAPFVAALVPLLITLKFLLTGLGLISDPDTVQSICRTGNPKELLYGPLLYGITFIMCDVIFWRHSPSGITGLMVLCGGDGLAEVVGKRYGQDPSMKLPWSRTKSWPGSFAMFLGSFVFSAVFLFLFNSWGNFSPPLQPESTIFFVLLISLVASVAESLCWEHWDNVVVPLLAITLCSWAEPWMRYSSTDESWAAQ